MNYSTIEYYTSRPRLQRYLNACYNSKDKALHLYGINVKVSQSFYPILNLFEVFLRNAINNNLINYFGNADWIINEKDGFMSDPSLGPSFKLYYSVDKTENYFRRRGIPVNSGKILAEQSFSFWTRLFDRTHYPLIEGRIIHSFPKRPTYVGRNSLNNKLNEIRKFRNRVYHNEPICFNRDEINFDRAKSVKANIFNLLFWINNEIHDYVHQFNSVDSEISKGESLIEEL